MENEDKDVLIREYLGVPEKLTSRLMRDRFGQFVCDAFHNKTCIRSAMESVIEIAGGAPSGLGRSLLGSDLALGIGSIPLV